MTSSKWIPVLLVLACDSEPEVDVAGLERKVEVMQQSLGEAAEARAALETKMGERAADNKKLSTDLASAKLRIDDLESRVADLELRPEPPPPPPPSKLPTTAGRPVKGERYNVPLGDAMTKGSATAKVTIVIWSDFQCPYCKRVQATLEELERQYGTDLRFAMKHNPLPMHTKARDAALAAEAAGRQGKFWAMHDLLYENSTSLTQANFVKWARKLRLDVARFKKDLADAASERKIKAHQAEATTLGARGVPAFFINGRYLSGAQPLTAFQTLVDEEVIAADKLLATGHPAKKIYEELISTGKDRPD